MTYSDIGKVKMINLIRKLKIFWLLVVLIALSSCNQGPRPPIEVDIISIEPEPIVGQVTTVTFTVEANAANQDIPSTAITPYLFKGLESEVEERMPIWEGTLLAEEPLEFSWAFCITEPGRWRLLISAQSTEGATKGYGGGVSRYIESDFEHAKIAKYFEGPAELIITVDPTLIVPGKDTPTLVPNENQVEEVPVNPTIESQIILSQECLQADSQP